MNARKREEVPQKDREAHSAELRRALDFIQRRNFSEGLEVLNQLAGRASAPRWRAKILSAVADAYMRQGDYRQAAAAYERAETQVKNSPRDWLRPAVGRVFCELMAGRYPEALAKARKVGVQSEDVSAIHGNQIARAVTGAEFAGLPHRPCVVWTRLGTLFLDQGFVDEADEFFRRAVTLEPRGASRGRLGLAQIAMRRKQWAHAAACAQDAIVIGKFQHKTLQAIPVFLQASLATGAKLDILALLSQYGQRKKRVRDSAYFLAVSFLRAQRDPAWKDAVQNWLALPGKRDPVIECEFHKLLLAEAKVDGAPTSRKTALARRLMEVSGLRFSEWSFAARELIKAEPTQQRFDELANDASQRFGSRLRWLATSRLARAADEAGQTNFARLWLYATLHGVPEGTPAKGQLKWGLARLEERTGRSEEAAALYIGIYSSAQTPLRFHLPALVGWARCAVRAGRTDDLLARKPEFERALSATQDYGTLLDTARLLLDAPGELNKMLPSLADRGEELAKKIVETSADPAQARKAWVKLVKRSADLGRSSRVLAFWKGLPTAARERLWSGDESYWDAMAFLVRAMRKSGDVSESLALAREWLEDPSTPLCGLIHVGVQCAFSEMRLGDRTAAAATFEGVTQLAPTHIVSALGYYWLAVRAYAHGDVTSTVALAGRMGYCLGDSPSLLWQQMLRLRGILLEERLNVAAALARLSPSYERALVEELSGIQTDMLRIA